MSIHYLNTLVEIEKRSPQLSEKDKTNALMDRLTYLINMHQQEAQVISDFSNALSDRIKINDNG